MFLIFLAIPMPCSGKLQPLELSAGAKNSCVVFCMTCNAGLARVSWDRQLRRALFDFFYFFDSGCIKMRGRVLLWLIPRHGVQFM